MLPCFLFARRSAVWGAACLSLALSVFALAGCSHDQSNGVQAPPIVTAIDPVTGKTSTSDKAQTLDGQPTKPTTLPSPAVTEADLGLPFYPGSAPYRQLGGEAVSSTANGIVSAMLETKDPVDTVVAFYKGKMTLPDADGKMQEPMVTEDRQDGRRKVSLSYAMEGAGLRSAEIRDEEGTTIIQLMRLEGSSASTHVGISNLMGGGPKRKDSGAEAPRLPGHHDELPTGTRP